MVARLQIWIVVVSKTRRFDTGTLLAKGVFELQNSVQKICDSPHNSYGMYPRVLSSLGIHLLVDVAPCAAEN